MRRISARRAPYVIMYTFWDFMLTIFGTGQVWQWCKNSKPRTGHYRIPSEGCYNTSASLAFISVNCPLSGVNRYQCMPRKKENKFVFSATGVLKGFDALLNIVLDNTTEYLRGRLIIFNLLWWCEMVQIEFIVAYAPVIWNPWTTHSGSQRLNMFWLILMIAFNVILLSNCFDWPKGTEPYNTQSTNKIHMCYIRSIKVKKVTIMYAKSTTMETADQGGTALLTPLVVDTKVVTSSEFPSQWGWIYGKWKSPHSPAKAQMKESGDFKLLVHYANMGNKFTLACDVSLSCVLACCTHATNG